MCRVGVRGVVRGIVKEVLLEEERWMDVFDALVRRGGWLIGYLNPDSGVACFLSERLVYGLSFLLLIFQYMTNLIRHFI